MVKESGKMSLLRKRLTGVGLLIFLVACSRGFMTHEAVREAAEGYYSMLINGDYKDFVEGYADAGSMPGSFRAQLEDAIAQFMSDGNMQNLTAVSATSDSIGTDSTAVVRLQLHFSDSTCEQIEMSLLLEEDGWKMR